MSVYRPTPQMAGIAKGTCIPPEGGWKDQTYYVVEISWNSHNPVYRAILYVGFVPSTPPKLPRFPELAGGYTSLMQDTSGIADNGVVSVQDLYYIKAIAAIPGIGALDQPEPKQRRWPGAKE